MENCLSFPLLDMDTPLLGRIRALGAALERRGICCAAAESCTGGLLGAVLTAVPGASLWFAGGVTAYADSVKKSVLGVAAADIERHGAVSGPVARGMASGVCALLDVSAAVSLSGVAGPDGGTALKPVGLVWVGFAVDGRVDALELRLAGSREDIRAEAVRRAVAGLLERVG